MDIARLAKASGMLTELESGAASCVWTPGVDGVSSAQLEKFADLVAAVEREACAKVCDRHATNQARHGDTVAAEQSRQDAVAIRARSNAQVTGASPALMAKRPVD